MPALITPSLREMMSLVGIDRQTIVRPVVESYVLSSDGTTTGRTVDVTLPGYDRLGPFVQSVQVATACEGKSPNFRFKAQAAGSTTGRTYGTPFDLFPWLSANAETTETAYTAVSNLGMFTRYGLVGANTAGTAIESGVIWLYLLIRLRA